ncbi:MAG: winged helix-turn-helix domain-containing protein [Pyrinomonadaceae bacterium]|nr:winged helix-turn-helix domain-containing protein [Pyrinomonadaceae bacterium]
MDDNGYSSIFFDEFELDLGRRKLFRNGEAIALKSKAFDLLVTLVESPGTLLSKDDLLNRVWEGQFVEENNLTVHIAALRKALGERKGEHRFIVTVPGKGYRFVGEVREEATEDLIVETHKVQRITIEERVENTDEPVANGLARTELPQRSRLNARLAAVGGLIVLAVLVGAAFVWQGIKGYGSNAVNPLAGGRFTRLTNNGRVRIAALSPDGNRFAYVTRDGGRHTLWTGDVNGGEHIRLRPESDEEYIDLAFDPGSGSLLFSVRASADADPVLYRMPSLGGPVERLRVSVENFSLSSDGQWLAFASKMDGEAGKTLIAKAPLNGGENITIAEIEGLLLKDSLSWSSDGTQIAVIVGTGFESYSEIVFLSASGGELRRIRRPEWQEIGQIVWTEGDGGLIVTALERTSWAAVPQLHLYHIDLATDAATPITNDLSTYGTVLDYSRTSNRLLTIERRQMNNVWVAPAEDLSAARSITNSSFGRYDGLWGLGWTHDGKLIYTTSDTRSQVIAQMNADGTEQKLLTSPGSVDSALAVSPDGTFVTFHSRRSGRFNIWRMGIDGSDVRQLTFTDNAFQPFVSPDNVWIYYKDMSNGAGGLARVPANGGAAEVLTSDGASWGRFSPDGKTIAAGIFTDRLTVALYSAADHSLIRKFKAPPTATSFVGIGWMPDGRSVIYRDMEAGYWIQPIEGGEPQRLEKMPEELLYNFSWSNDGKYFAFVRGQDIRDVVLLSPAKD